MLDTSSEADKIAGISRRGNNDTQATEFRDSAAVPYCGIRFSTCSKGDSPCVNTVIVTKCCRVRTAASCCATTTKGAEMMSEPEHNRISATWEDFEWGSYLTIRGGFIRLVVENLARKGFAVSVYGASFTYYGYTTLERAKAAAISLGVKMLQEAITELTARSHEDEDAPTQEGG